MLSRKLRWTLGITLVLTAIALLTPDELAPRTAVERDEDRSASRPPATAASEAPMALPTELERQAFAPPERDLFAEPAVPAPAPVPLPAAPPAPPPPPPPPPPAFTARYVAQMLTPAGERLLYFRDGEQLVAAQVGTLLSGYVVEALVRADAQGRSASGPTGIAGGDIVAVAVVHPPSNHRELIQIPALNRPPSQ